MIGKIVFRLDNWIKRLIYKQYSNNPNIHGDYESFQPIVFKGKGEVRMGDNVKFGVVNSPFFHNTYAYVEARTSVSEITIGSNTRMNNAVSIIAEKKIIIGSNVLIGYNCSIMDSNFHNLAPEKRHESDPRPESVIIHDNVFIGNDVTILKGVCLEENVVVAARSVVTKSFPKNSVIGGCPAVIIGKV
ncbi:acyltransferase [Algibacter lectus]|uniref:Maltose O-acetyltransferase n=2 Tax=Algibacter lectus TaxID=221126 RepID=A0A4R8M351_9FLAO|nr:acyltransferase [Algibacter lectus]MWW26608.1 acyltransferase [Algibacter lectus]TDY59610.1 maltose O-acetyltransferase [Algibacter lectus]